jgi:signal transduction histidine kinase
LKSRMEELALENARLSGDLLTMAHRISHDLRTPLGSINAATEVLKEMASEGQSDIHGQMIKSIFDSTDDIVKLLDRVSFVLKASVRPVPWEKVDMGRVVFESLEKLERAARKKNAVISQPDTWPEVSGVVPWLRTIWWNLLSNSLQHSPEGVRIRLDWKRESDAYRFWISDDGGGIPPDRHPKLFQTFQSLYEPDAKRGLGLAIVQRLVELQNGDCGYETIGNQGSLFFFTLPLRQPEDSREGAGSKEPGQPATSMADAIH